MASSTGTAHADDTGDAIVVTGHGLADAPSVPAYDVVELGRERITSSASGRIEDVLSTVAGFQQFRRSDSRSSNPSAQGVTLRALGGNATSRTLVLLDGVPMADPMFGYIPLSALSPERLGGIRVTRGAGAGAFGAGAVAGTIELTSADAQQLGLVNASALVNDRGETEAALTVAPQLGQGFAVAGVRWDRGQGFWTTPKSQRNAASVTAGFESWSASLRAVAPLSHDIELQARVMAFDDQRELRFDGADTANSGQDASLRLVGRGAWQFDALAYVQARDFSNIVISSSTFRKTLDQRRTPSTGLGGKLEVRPLLGANHVLRLGADWRLSDGELQEEAYNAAGAITARRRAGGRNSDVGLYAEHDWALGPLVLTGGIRLDRWTVRSGFFAERSAEGVIKRDLQFADRAGWETSYRGGAAWQAAEWLKLRAAAYSGIRLPTLNELYRPFVVFPVTTQANAALQNERLRGIDAGIEVSPVAGFSLSFTGFDDRVKNAIANVTIATNLRERRNVDAIRSRGVELGAHWRMGRFAIDGGLALTKVRVEASGISAGLDGMRPAQTPKFVANGTVSWRPADGWLLSATVRRTGAQYEDDLESDVLPATTTFDASAEIPLHERFSLIFRGENLTGERIITRNQSGSMDLGVPRTVWAGFKLRLKQ